MEKTKWYFKPYFFIIAFLCVGPFALPLIWFNPRLNITKKIIITAIILILSFYVGLIMMKSVSSILSYYQQLSRL